MAMAMAPLIELLLLGALAVPVLYLGLPALAKPLLRRRFLGRVERAGRVCLTFDDGPDPRSTPQILELLDRAGVRATFFMIGARARRHPELVRRVARAGHEIGEHGLAHRNAWKTAPWAYARDLWGGRAALAGALAGASAAALRPPFGKLNLLTLLYAGLQRRRLAFWDVDPRDYARDSAEEVAGEVLDRLEQGHVVLLHDGRVRPEGDPAVTVDALRLILERAALRGLRFATLGEALAATAGGADGGASCTTPCP